MYQIIEENSKFLRDLKNDAYSRILGMTAQNISNVFVGQTTKLSTAKGIISARYNISPTDERMDALVEKHFRKLK